MSTKSSGMIRVALLGLIQRMDSVVFMLRGYLTEISDIDADAGTTIGMQLKNAHDELREGIRRIDAASLHLTSAVASLKEEED